MGRKKKNLDIEEILETEDNVAELLRGETLDEIGRNACEGFQRDKNSRKEWEKRNVDMMKLALQVAEEKSWPWEGASNVKYPLLTVAAIQFAARVDLFQGPDIVQAKVIGDDPAGEKADRALRIKKHMSYQLLEEMEEWESDNDRLLIALPIVGSMFKKTYYDPVRERNRSELVYPQDLVFDYWAKDVESAFRKTHVLNLTPNQVEERVRNGSFLEEDLQDRPPSERIERETAEDVEGLTGYEDDEMPYKFLEQHKLLDLDDDGYKEPYVVTVHKDSEKTLRIIPRFDRTRCRIVNGRIRWIEPVEYFTQFPFIPDPSGGNLGIGYGRLQGHLNEVANTLINQLVDAGTLNITQGGFISKGIRLRAGDMNFDRMGEWKVVNTSGVSLKDGIFPIPTRPPDQTLFLLLQMIVEGAEKVGSITDALVGEAPNPNTPATSTLATLEQGLKVFKAINKRLYKAYTKEFKKLFALNRQHLKASDYFEVVGISNEEKTQVTPQTAQVYQKKAQFPIGKVDYEKAKGVIPSADPNADTGVERAKKTEVLLGSMQLGWPVEEVKKRVVENMNIPNPDALLVPQPPPPPPYQVQVAQMQMQSDQAKLAAETQVKMGQLQIEQQRAALDVKKAEAEIQRMQMEMAKMEAEIRQIIAEVQDESEGEKAQIEIQKAQAELQFKVQELQAELEMKKAELELKKQELQLKAQEMQLNLQMQQQQMQMQQEMKRYEVDTNAQTARDTDKNRVAGKAMEKADGFMQGMDGMMGRMEEHEKKRGQPREIKRDGAGLLSAGGNMQIRRGADGRATHIEPMEEGE